MLQQFTQFSLSCGMTHQFEGCQEMVNDFYHQTKNIFDFFFRFVDVNHQSLIMICIVESYEDFNRFLVQLHILENVILKKIVVSRLISTFFSHQHQDVLHNCQVVINNRQVALHESV